MNNTQGDNDTYRNKEKVERVERNEPYRPPKKRISGIRNVPNLMMHERKKIIAISIGLGKEVTHIIHLRGKCVPEEKIDIDDRRRL